MAYTKQTWTNDVTAITAERMTHIENGIYDNSLATDIINPSGTATTTAEIEEGQINDVIGFKSLKLKGQTSQHSTIGYNKLPPAESGTYTSSQMTHKSDGKGTYTFNGTANAVSSHYWEIEPYTIQSGDYLYLGNYVAQSGVSFSLYENSSTEIASLGSSTTTNRIISLNDYAGKTITLVRTYSLAQTLSNYEIKPMICNTSTRTTFEEYTGEKASPNPDFPQDVNNVGGDNVVGISNKNLIDGQFRQGGWGTTPSLTRLFTTQNYPVKSGVTYTISTTLNTTAFKYAVQLGSLPYPQSTSPTFYDSGWKTNGTFTFTASANGYFGITVAKSNGTDNLTPSDISNATWQLEVGSTATSYVAHQGNNFEINLGKNLANIDDIQLQKNWQNVTDTTRASILNIKVKPSTTYTLSSSYKSSSITNVRCILFGEIGDTTHKGVVTGTFTTTSTTNYLSIEVLANATFTQSMLNGLEIQLEKGAIATSYAPYYNIEICKIGTYQDYIFKKDGKYYKRKAIDKVLLTSSMPASVTASATYGALCYLNIGGNYYDSTTSSINVISNRLIGVSYNDRTTLTDSYRVFTSDNGSVTLRFPVGSSISSTSDVQTFLTNNEIYIYAVLKTPVDEEITYAPLLRQLDELYNSGLYDVTNISQDNSSEAFVLDIEACKNNINGIVEYIRR